MPSLTRRDVEENARRVAALMNAGAKTLGEPPDDRETAGRPAV